MSTVLLIEDDPENRDILKTRLEQAGYQVIEAQNGEEGLSLAATRRPDLVILDVMMPKIDGWQVCRLLKAGPSTGRIPIVMLTACSKQVEELRGYESGADDYMMKPWEFVRLLEMVKKHIPVDLKAEVLPPKEAKPIDPAPQTGAGGVWA